MGRGRIAVAALAVALAASASARAAVFVVNSTNLADTNCQAVDRDDPAGDLNGLGSCSLPAAVGAANDLDGEDEIVINLPGNQTVTLLQTLQVTEDVEINAAPLVGWLNAQQLTSFTVQAGPGVTELLELGAGAGTTLLRNVVLADGNVEIMTGGRVSFLQGTGSATFAENVSGAGILEKEGAGTLVLTGANSYTGSTVVSQGTLQGDTLSIPGGDALDPLDVVDNAKLVFDQEVADPDDFFGVISGTGSLEKTGDGILFLRSPNSYEGGTTITDGTLIGFADGDDGSLQGNIVNNSVLIFVQPDDGSFDGNISGSGRVEKTEAGTLTLTGANSFTGGLTITQGLVIGSSRSMPGDVAIASGAQLEFQQDSDGTHAGGITGGGVLPAGQYTVTKSGPGTLTLTGVNDYDGGTLVSQGRLVGTTQSLQRQIDLADDTTLEFSQSFDGSFAGDIRGLGALEKSGAGAVTFTESQDNFALGAGTRISGGRLVIGAAGLGDGAATTLPGDLVVGPGATLAGIGSVGGAVTVEGTVVPQSRAPGLRVGSVSFSPGSALEVVADGGGFADLLAVTGNATLTSEATLRFDLENVDRDTPFDAPVLTAGSIAGTLFSNDQTSAFFDVDVVPSGNTVLLRLTPNGRQLPEFADSSNQAAVGQALEDALDASPPPDLELVEDEFTELSAEEIPEILDAMAGEQLSEFATTRLAIGERLQASVQQRIRGVAWSDGEALLAQEQGGAGAAPVLAANPILQRSLPGLAQGDAWPTWQAGQQSMSSVLDSATSFEPAQGEHGLGGWIDGYGLFGALDGDSGSNDLDYTIGGVSLGLDYLLAQRWLVGVAGGYAYSDLDFDGLEGSQNANTGQGALYAGYVLPWLQLGLSGRFGYSAMESRREIEFMDRDADADFDGWDAGARAEAALDVVALGPVELQPLASLSYTHLQQDAFDESGADSLDLDVDEQEVDSLVSGLGARLHGVLQIDEELWFHPELRASWLHEFGDQERELSVRIGGTPGAGYTVRGAEVPADAGVFGVSWTVVATQRLHAFASYDVTLGSELLQQGASVGLKLVW